MGAFLSNLSWTAVIFLAVATALLAGFSTSAVAQELTPRDIQERAREDHTEIEQSIDEFEEVAVESDSGHLTGYLASDNRIRKAVHRPAGPDGPEYQEFFFRNGDPFFVFEIWPDVEGDRQEYRYYLSEGKLEHWIDPGLEAQDPTTGEATAHASRVYSAARAAQAELEPSVAGAAQVEHEPSVLVQLVDTMGWPGFGVTAFITALIVGLFLWFSWRYLRPLRRAAKAMVTAKSKVSGAGDAPSIIFPRGPNTLQELWEDFLQRRQETTRAHVGKQISTIDPAEVFYEDAVFGAYNRNFAVTLAGFFTGLGILGTFAGLVLGLHRIDTSPGGVLDSVGGLLGGMSTAFYTSLIGIFFSLIWLVLDRLLFGSAQKAMNEFLRAVRINYPVEGPDRLLHHLLTVEQSENKAIHESKALLEDQKGILQSLSVDLAVALEDAFTESLDKTLTPRLEKMTGALESLSVQMGDRQVSALDQMVDRFQSQLSTELHGHLDGLAGSIAKAAEWQEIVHSQLEDLTTRLSEAANRQADLVESTNAAASTFANSLAALGEANAMITRSLGSLESASSSIDSVATGIGGQAEILKARISELGEENEIYREANEEIRVNLARQIDALDSRQAELDTFWEKLGGELAEVGKDLQAGATEFSTLATQKLQEIFSRFDSEMATVVEHLAGTLAEIREVTDDLPRNVAALGGHLQDHTGSMNQASEKLEQTLDRLQAMEQLAEALSRLKPAATSVEGLVERLDTASGAISQLANQVAAVDGRIAEVVAQSTNGDNLAARQPATSPSSESREP